MFNYTIRVKEMLVLRPARQDRSDMFQDRVDTKSPLKDLENPRQGPVDSAEILYCLYSSDIVAGLCERGMPPPPPP